MKTKRRHMLTIAYILIGVGAGISVIGSIIYKMESGRNSKANFKKVSDKQDSIISELDEYSKNTKEKIDSAEMQIMSQIKEKAESTISSINELNRVTGQVTSEMKSTLENLKYPLPDEFMLKTIQFEIDEAHLNSFKDEYIAVMRKVEDETKNRKNILTGDSFSSVSTQLNSENTPRLAELFNGKNLKIGLGVSNTASIKKMEERFKENESRSSNQILHWNFNTAIELNKNSRLTCSTELGSNQYTFRLSVYIGQEDYNLVTKNDFKLLGNIFSSLELCEKMVSFDANILNHGELADINRSWKVKGFKITDSLKREYEIETVKDIFVDPFKEHKRKHPHIPYGESYFRYHLGKLVCTNI